MSDMARMVPVAGMMLNSVGRVWGSGVLALRQWTLDSLVTCWLLVPLGGPAPSPRTRRAYVRGTREVLNRVQLNV